MNIVIRLAKGSEIDEILEVELIAGQRFREYGIDIPEDEIEEDDETNEGDQFGDEHREGIENERLWVAVTPDHQIVGFALAQEIDDEGHLREIDVLPDFGRKGIGRALINTVATWCTKQGFDSLSLTTFKDVPWNRPYYEKLGFHIIADSDLSGELQVMVQEERERSSHARVPMRRVLI